MKTKQKQTEKSTMEQLREIRDKISVETQDMTFEQLQKYIEEQMKESLHPKANWNKVGSITV
jgi:ferritin